MNYRHDYHAGNFADVLKHFVLVQLLEHFNKKDAAYCYLDAYAGSPFYDLESTYSEKTQEYQHGILKIINTSIAPNDFLSYLNIVRIYNKNQEDLKIYPGSSCFAYELKRVQDRIILNEKNEQVFILSRDFFKNKRKTQCTFMSAEQALRAHLPFQEKRGLILLDPPYEQPDQGECLIGMVEMALRSFSQGIYAVWYPIKQRPSVETWKTQFMSVVQRPTMWVELSPYSEINPFHLNGCGMMIVNPPWTLKDILHRTLPWLTEQLAAMPGACYRLRESS